MTTIHISTITPILILLLLSQHARAQSSAPRTTPGAPVPGNDRRSRPTTLTIAINLLIALFFILFMCIYVRFYYMTSPSRNDFVVPRRRLGSLRQSYRAPRGLDIEVIKTFPIFKYSAVKSEKIGKGTLECAVCLNEFEDDDTLRLIPYCDHVFHPDCIDAWLVGHKTCPVCRCNLADAAEAEQTQANDVVVEVGDEARENDNNENEVNNESMEQPLRGKMRRSRTMRNLSFGRPRWLGKLARSFSTGHVAAMKQLENMERFTLRLPEKVRTKLLMRRKLEKTTSLIVLPRESSTRSSYTSRGRFGSVRVDRSGRWGISLVPPFITRAASMKSPSAVAPKPTCSQASSLCGSSQENVMGASGERSFCDAIQAELSQLPI